MDDQAETNLEHKQIRRLHPGRNPWQIHENNSKKERQIPYTLYPPDPARGQGGAPPRSPASSRSHRSSISRRGIGAEGAGEEARSPMMVASSSHACLQSSTSGHRMGSQSSASISERSSQTTVRLGCFWIELKERKNQSVHVHLGHYRKRKVDKCR
jgi:hypothetical protein